jgi:hypothetical protein
MDEMGKQKTPADPNMEDDEFLRRIMPEAGSPDVTVLAGVFLGRGADNNLLRLYTTLSLSSYYQLPNDKVLGIKRRPDGQVLVWVPRDLKVQIVSSQSMTAELLNGSIQSAFMNRAQRTGGFGSLARRALQAPPQPVTRDPFCVTSVGDPDNPICTVTCPPPPSC